MLYKAVNKVTLNFLSSVNSKYIDSIVQLVVWLPALCRKMGVPYCIVKGKARLVMMLVVVCSSILLDLSICYSVSFLFRHQLGPKLLVVFC